MGVASGLPECSAAASIRQLRIEDYLKGTDLYSSHKQKNNFKGELHNKERSSQVAFTPVARYRRTSQISVGDSPLLPLNGYMLRGHAPFPKWGVQHSPLKPRKNDDASKKASQPSTALKNYEKHNYFSYSTAIAEKSIPFTKGATGNQVGSIAAEVEGDSERISEAKAYKGMKSPLSLFEYASVNLPRRTSVYDLPLSLKERKPFGSRREGGLLPRHMVAEDRIRGVAQVEQRHGEVAHFFTNGTKGGVGTSPTLSASKSQMKDTVKLNPREKEMIVENIEKRALEAEMRVAEIQSTLAAVEHCRMRERKVHEEKYKELMLDRDAVTTQFRQLQQQNVENETERSRLLKVIDALQVERDTKIGPAEQEITELKRLLAATRERMDADADAAQARINLAKASAKAIEERAQERNASLSLHLKDAMQKSESLQERIVELQVALQERTEEANALGRKLDALKKESQNSIEVLRPTVALLEAEVKKLGSEKRELQAILKAKEEEIRKWEANSKSQKDDEQDNAATFAALLKKTSCKNKELVDSLAEKTNALDGLQKTIDNLLRDKSALKKELERSESKVCELQQRVDDSSEEFKAIQALLEQEKQDRDRLQSECREWKCALEALQEELNRASANNGKAIQELQKVIKEKASCVARLEQELSNCKSQAAALEAETRKQKEETAQFGVQVEDLQRELKEERKRTQELRVMFEEAMKTKEAVEHEMQLNLETLERANASIQSLTDALESHKGEESATVRLREALEKEQKTSELLGQEVREMDRFLRICIAQLLEPNATTSAESQENAVQEVLSGLRDPAVFQSLWMRIKSVQGQLHDAETSVKEWKERATCLEEKVLTLEETAEETINENQGPGDEAKRYEEMIRTLKTDKEELAQNMLHVQEEKDRLQQELQDAICSMGQVKSTNEKRIQELEMKTLQLTEQLADAASSLQKIPQAAQGVDVKLHEDTINSLNAERNQLKETLEKEKSALSDLTKKYHTLLAENESLRERRAQSSQREIGVRSQSVAGTDEEELHRESSNIRLLEADKTRLEENNTELQASRDAYAQRLEELTAQYEGAMQRVKDLEAQNENLRQTTQDAKPETVEKDNAELQATRDAYAQRLEELTAQYEGAMQRVKDLEAQNENLRQTTQDAKPETVEKDNAELQATRDAYAQRLEELTAEYEGAMQRVKDLEAQNENLRQTTQDAEAGTLEKEEMFSKTLAQWEQEKNLVALKVSELEQENQTLSALKATLQAENDHLHNKLNTIAQKIKKKREGGKTGKNDKTVSKLKSSMSTKSAIESLDENDHTQEPVSSEERDRQVDHGNEESREGTKSHRSRGHEEGKKKADKKGKKSTSTSQEAVNVNEGRSPVSSPEAKEGGGRAAMKEPESSLIPKEGKEGDARHTEGSAGPEQAFPLIASLWDVMGAHSGTEKTSANMEAAESGASTAPAPLLSWAVPDFVASYRDHQDELPASSKPSGPLESDAKDLSPEVQEGTSFLPLLHLPWTPSPVMPFPDLGNKVEGPSGTPSKESNAGSGSQIGNLAGEGDSAGSVTADGTTGDTTREVSSESSALSGLEQWLKPTGWNWT